MKKVSQKDAVYGAVVTVLEKNGVDFKVNEDILSEVMDRDLRTLVVGELVSKFKVGEIVLAKDFTDKELKTYVGGLVSNWTKKDLRLNGGIPHEIRKPGSRIGQTDPMAKELRKMLLATKGTKNEVLVRKELKNRQEKLRKDQAASIVIDKQFIPESLQHLL